MNNTRVLLIGLDGATWELLKPWAEEGKLPTIGMLMKNGVWAKLESTVPPITSPAWPALATGMNPGKLGVFDFLSRKDSSYKLQGTKAGDLRGRAIWDYISDEGRNKVAVVSYPTLFPPYSVNGLMVSKVISTHLAFTAPQSLAGHLNEVCDGYEDLVPYHNEKYDDTDLFLRDLNRIMDKQIKAVRYLLKEPWDLFMYVLSATDWAQHLMWKHIDRNHPLYDTENSRKYESEFLKFWQRVDDFLEEIVHTNQDTNIFIVSDHGFGPQDECLNLAKWLEEKGYLVRKNGKGNRASTGLKSLVLPALRTLARTKLRRLVPESLIGKVGSKLKPDISNEIDFTRSKAYVLGHTIPIGAIYLNVEGRDPQGFVKEDEYGRLKAQIVNDLKDLKQDIGQDVKVQVFDSKEIYSGGFVDKAPDILFTIDNWRCIVNESRFDGPLFKNEPYSNRHTGSHRMNGVFAACGPDIKNTGEEIRGVKIYDIAPTILHMFDVPIPSEMDGRVLKEIFRDDSKFTQARIRYDQKRDAGETRAGIRGRIRELKSSNRI